jgi:hypothetical protein
MCLTPDKTRIFVTEKFPVSVNHSEHSRLIEAPTKSQRYPINLRDFCGRKKCFSITIAYRGFPHDNKKKRGETKNSERERSKVAQKKNYFTARKGFSQRKSRYQLLN